MSSLTNTVLGLAAIGVGGYVLVKYVLPRIDFSLDDVFGPIPSSRSRDRDDDDDGPDTIIIEDRDEPEKVPVYIPSPPQTIVEERLVPVSPPPVYIYPNPIIPNCSRGRYWDGDSCRKIECPTGFHWDDGICKPKDCDRDEYFDGSRCRPRPPRYTPHECDRDEYWDGTRCKSYPKPRNYNPPTPRPTRDYDREGRDRDRNDRNARDWKLSDIFGGRDDDDDRPTTTRNGGGRTGRTRPTTNITTLLTPSPKVDEDEEEEVEGGRPKTSPVAAMAAFTGKRYEYI